jgi:uncharacterized membrane-anchored protein
MKTRTLLRAGILTALALVGGAALHAVRNNERIIAQGRVVLVELGPVDPRSLMQGDYMMLRFAIDDALPQAGGEAPAAPPPRFAHLALDASGRARLLAVAQTLPAGADEVGMRIRARDGRYSIGPNAFFFQEGQAGDFAAARWGEFRVAPDGTALLTHLRDEALSRLGAQRW